MVKTICNFFFWKQGWKLKYEDSPELHRCVMMAAPHTSNWDFPITIAAFTKMKIPMRFAIKKEWMKFPFNLIMKPLGAIAIDRTPEPGKPKKKMVDLMADLFKEHKEICIVLTPEGTRKKRTRWKTGFYYVAMKAKVPIALGYCDFRKKEAGVLKVFHPTGDMDADMKMIMKHYMEVNPRHPELYSPDLRYI